MAANKNDYSSIKKDILSNNIAPIYLLHGEESYFIDELVSLLEKKVLTEEEKDFNFLQYYGAEANVGEVITVCRRFPMFAERQLVMLKEAQALDRSSNLDQFETYFNAPCKSTVLVIAYKNKSIDGRKKIVKLANENGVVFESKRIRDYELPKVVPSIIKEKGYAIEDQAVKLLCDNIGSDLAKIMVEISKLSVNLSNKRITLDVVASQIGVSKEFNNWELQSAIATRDLKKVEQIRRYFISNPKANPVVVTLSSLFSFFSNLMLAHYAPDKSEKGIMEALKLNNVFAAREYMKAMKIYNAWKTMSNISLIREYDAKYKGARKAYLGDDAILKELLFKLTH